MSNKILIADDDRNTVTLIGRVLEREGYDIVAARTGKEALEQVEAEDPDLILLDVMMPDHDGFEVVRRLRGDPKTADVPVIMFTARDTVEDKVTGFEAGADDYLTKPVHLEELVSRVKALLRRFGHERPTEPARGARIVGFLGTKGGVGTTTLAVNAAVTLASGGSRSNEDQEGSRAPRVVLAEMRHGMATAALQLGIPHRGGVASVLEQPVEELDAQFLEAQLEEHASGLLVLGGRTAPLGAGKTVPPDHAEAIVRLLGASPGYLFLDLGVGLDEANRRLLPLCSRVVVTIEPDSAALVLTEDLLEAMNQTLNIPRHRISLVVIKRSRSASTLNKTFIEDRLEHELLSIIPPAPELAFESTKQQSPMVMLDVDSLLVRQINQFVEGLTQAL